MIFILFSSCGYRTGNSGQLSSYSTVSVPYVYGDRDGDLTSAIIEELSSSACFRYERECGELLLYVRILDFRDLNIGFRYDRDKDSSLNKSVIPAETRYSILTQVEVIERGSGCSVLGPVELWTSIDFDHDYYSSRDGINVFSLGQLSDYDAAHDVALHPLHRKLAQKIVDYLKYSW